MISVTLQLMQSFITEGETVLIKWRHLILTVCSYRRDLILVRLILISEINYKTVLHETYFNSLLQVSCKISVAT
jgi:hypothetical protein